MANLRSQLAREDARAAMVVTVTAALLISILLITHPFPKNLLIGMTGGPVYWTLLLVTGSSPRVKRARGLLRAAAAMVFAFAASLAAVAGPPLLVMFLALVAWERFDADDERLWRWITGGNKRDQR